MFVLYFYDINVEDIFDGFPRIGNVIASDTVWCLPKNLLSANILIWGKRDLDIHRPTL